MMEKVEIPTLYFTPLAKHNQFPEKILHDSEFWNSFSQSQKANSSSQSSTPASHSILSTNEKTVCHLSGKCCDLDEVKTQSDHNHPKNSSPILNSISSKSHPEQKSRSNAKLKLQFKWHQVFLLISLLTLSSFCQVSEECPQPCECKWKGGKESVICANGKPKLTAIPNGLEPGTQLLDLSKNNIVLLQSKVFHSLNLLNLQKIFLTGCNLKTLEKNVFYKLNNLVELDLSGNKLDAIPTHTFDQIPEVRELKLNSNPVTRIPSNAFSSLTRLVRLELSRCRIRTVDSAAFRGLVSLEWLKLDNNRLSTVHVVSFYPLRNLHGLEIAENPWNCSCTLQPLRDWMSKNNVPYGVPPTCDQPARLSSKSWDQLQREDFACLPKVQSSLLAETGELTKTIEGENATLLCRLQATADTQVRWMNGKKPVAVSSSSSTRYFLSESFVQEKATPLPNSSATFSGAKQTLGQKTSKLTILRTKLRDSGTYSCRAETRAGFVSANFTLQVLQQSAERLSGRFLLYGATVATLLTLSICLLLVCVMFFCGKTKSSIPLTHDKVDNHVPHHQNGGRLLQNGHARNGGTSIPLLQDQYNHHNANGAPNYRPKNTGSSIISSFSILNPNRRPNPDTTATNNSSSNNPPTSRGLLNPQYKVLPTNEDPISVDHEDDDEAPHLDSSSDLEEENDKQESVDFPTCTNRNSKVLKINVPENQMPPNPISDKKEKFPDLINEERFPPTPSSLLRTGENMPAAAPRNMQLSVRPKALLPPNNQPVPSPIPIKPPESKPPIVVNSHHPSKGNESLSQPQPNQCEPHNQFSSPKIIPNGTKPHNPPPGGGGFPGQNNQSHSQSHYGSSSIYQNSITVHSSPPTFTKFTFTQQRQPPPIPAPRHQRTFSFSSNEIPNVSHPQLQQQPNPNHISFYRQSAATGQYSAGRPPFQRRSMPTSPIHLSSPHQYHHQYASSFTQKNKIPTQGSDPGQINHHEFVGQSQEYDYHAAQLAAFLEEYRHLQMELMRMSASLTEMDPQPSNSSPNKPCTYGTNSNINLNSMDSMTQRGATPSNANADFHQQQFNAILKSSGPNNNYLV